MLYIIGLGLDRKDMTIKAIEAIKKCEKIYLDAYTSEIPYSVEELQIFFKKKIFIVNRQFVEEEEKIFQEAKDGNIAFLVPGDPLAATTHIALILKAKKQGIETKIIHAPSILVAIAETGLILYKFGKVASIPKWQKGFKPESFYDVIQENLKINAHTLLLIDIGLDVGEAISCIKQTAEKRKDKKMLEKNIIVLENAGTEKREVNYAKLNELMEKKILLPACIIIPSELHFIEEEMLSLITKGS